MTHLMRLTLTAEPPTTLKMHVQDRERIAFPGQPDSGWLFLADVTEKASTIGTYQFCTIQLVLLWWMHNRYYCSCWNVLVCLRHSVSYHDTKDNEHVAAFEKLWSTAASRDRTEKKERGMERDFRKPAQSLLIPMQSIKPKIRMNVVQLMQEKWPVFDVFLAIILQQ